MRFNYLNYKMNVLNDNKSGLQKYIIAFLSERCEDLKTDNLIEEQEKKEGYKGTSLKENQIPFNMEKDIDRLCFPLAIKRFLSTGRKEDAFDVYFCYLEMFIGDYEKTRRMIELLSEFEANGSGLLMKHRDHYSHSVYVFCLGLALYESNDIYRNAYKKYYNLEDEKKAAHHFLEFWGLSALFHDIGYPFELPFEQVCSYFEVEGDKRKNRPFVSYNALDPLIKNGEKIKKKLKEIYRDNDTPPFDNSNELFAYVLTKKLSNVYNFTYDEMLGVLKQKPTEPNKFSHFMDHAYFSCAILFDRLFDNMDVELKEEHIDALTAILMHNSLYKFSIADIKEEKKKNIPFDVSLHPLAFLLMLCDELQCWDRTAYGRNSKVELHPFDCIFEFKNNTIEAIYCYDEKEIGKADIFVEKFNAWLKEKPANDKDIKDWKEKKPSLKTYSTMINYDKTCKFVKDIEEIVDLSKIELNVDIKFAAVDYSKRKTFLSDSNFINLYNFAAVLNGRYAAYDEWKSLVNGKEKAEFLNSEDNKAKFINDFKKLSLEYKLSNINQAKSFAEYINDIGCFYTNKSVDFEMVEEFHSEDLIEIGKKEHRRWLIEKYEMGWEYGENGKDYKNKDERERFRKHCDLINNPDFKYTGETSLTNKVVENNYNRLDKEEQDKDTEPMICMLAMLKMFDGLRIYKYK